MCIIFFCVFPLLTSFYLFVVNALCFSMELKVHGFRRSAILIFFLHSVQTRIYLPFIFLTKWPFLYEHSHLVLVRSLAIIMIMFHPILMVFQVHRYSLTLSSQSPKIMPSVEHIKQKFRAHVPFAMYTDSKKRNSNMMLKKNGRKKIRTISKWTNKNAKSKLKNSILV